MLCLTYCIKHIDHGESLVSSLFPDQQAIHMDGDFNMRCIQINDPMCAHVDNMVQSIKI